MIVLTLHPDARGTAFKINLFILNIKKFSVYIDDIGMSEDI